jgi:hypothetical protein
MIMIANNIIEITRKENMPLTDVKSVLAACSFNPIKFWVRSTLAVFSSSIFMRKFPANIKVK